jgi:zinc protease
VPLDKVELFRSQALNSLAHKDDSLGAIPGRAVGKLIYGADSLWAREPTLAQMASLTRDDVATWLAEWERPDAAVLGVLGDFDSSEMRALLQRELGAWAPPPGAGPPRVLPATPLPDQAAAAGRVFLVDRPGATQAAVAVGEVGIQMMDPDECALDVLGDVLNGFGGALFDQIRSREGLAYSVSGGWESAPPDHPGLFIAAAETARPAELLVALRRALAGAAAAPPASEDLARAKESSVNSFVFGFASNAAQLRRTATFELLGIPQDYPFTYQRRMAAVTAADVQAAAARRLHPERQVTVVAGDARTVRPALEAALGVTVEMMELE